MSDLFTLRFDYAYLLFRLKKYDELLDVLEKLENKGMSLASYIEITDEYQAKFKALQGAVLKNVNEPLRAIEAFTEAQAGYMRMMSGMGDDVAVVRQEVSRICFSMADICETLLKDFGRAVAYYNEAVQQDSKNSKVFQELIIGLYSFG